MNPVHELAVGSSYLWRGFALLREPSLRAFVIAPVLVNVVVIVGLIWVFGNRLDLLLDAWLAGLPGWLAWLEAVLWWLGILLAVLLFSYLFTLLANLIGGPFNGVLSARVERLVTGRSPESGLGVAREITDAIGGEIRRWSYYLGRASLLLLLTLVLFFIPLVHAVIPLIWFTFGAFMLAFEYLDNPMGNRGMRFADKLATLRERRWLNLGFGGVTTLVTMIPLANLVVMPAAVVGATLLWLEQIEPRRGERRIGKAKIPNHRTNGR